MDIFRGYRSIFAVVAKQDVRCEATLRSIDGRGWAWTAGKGRSVGHVVRIMVEVPVVCRGVIVVKRIAILLIVLKKRRWNWFLFETPTAASGPPSAV